jgi:uncharacterized protein YcgI (DUF1989 family)
VDLIYEHVMPPKTGLAVEVRDRQHLRLIDVEGKQVVDTAVFNLHNTREKLSTSNSRARQLPPERGLYVPADRVMEGDYLKSTLLRPMMLIVKETAEPKGVHDVHARFCGRWLYEALGVGSFDGCQEILEKAVAPYGIAPEDLPDTIDINMNFAHIPEEHRWEIREPVSRAGDYIELRACMDVLVAMSNCPEERYSPCNGYRCTPMKVEIWEGIPEGEVAPQPALAA